MAGNLRRIEIELGKGDMLSQPIQDSKPTWKRQGAEVMILQQAIPIHHVNLSICYRCSFEYFKYPPFPLPSNSSPTHHKPCGSLPPTKPSSRPSSSFPPSQMPSQSIVRMSSSTAFHSTWKPSADPSTFTMSRDSKIPLRPSIQLTQSMYAGH